ncbi:MAG: autotransporter-associated beta strand repeat-containing protein, partial [bacterium]
MQIQDGITVGAEALTLNGTGIGSTGALRNISGTNVWQGVVTLASAARINSDAGSLTFNTAASNITGTNQNLTLGGAGNGTIATTITTGTGNLTKDGSGTWTLSGANIYTGGTIVNGGTLDLGGGTASGSLASSLTLGGGTLAYTRTGSQTQTFTGTTINPGASAVTAVAGDILDLGAINRNVGGIVDVNTTGTIITSTANSNGILGGWATFGGNTWAVSAGSSAITGLASYTNDTWAAANNTTVTGSSSPGLGSTTNSLRFDAPGAYTLTLSGTNTITSGGILVTSAVVGNLSRITGGSLTAAPSKDLIVIQNNTGAGLTIDSIINNNTSTGLTKSGAGQLTLTAANTYTGSTRVNGGTLTVGIANSLGSLSAVSLSDTAGTTLNLQDFSTVIGSLAGGGKLGGNVILGNTGTNATLTLGGDNTTTEYAGIISGTHGITKTGSGIQTLSGNNTYTGTTTVNGGSLQLGSGGTSGSLSANSTIVLNNSSRFKINRSDSVTQGVDFGAITGGGYVDLLGTGTTTLVGTNTFAQHLIISAGNLNLTGAHNLDGSFTNLIITGAGLDNTSGGALTFANPISLTGSINFVGTSDLTFTGAV